MVAGKVSRIALPVKGRSSVYGVPNVGAGGPPGVKGSEGKEEKKDDKRLLISRPDDCYPKRHV